MRWFRRRTPKTSDPVLADAERRVRHLVVRADRVHDQLRPRMDRNHWSETVHELWTGKA